MTTLMEEVKAANAEKYKRAEKLFYDHIHNEIVTKIKEDWTGSSHLQVSVSRELVEQFVPTQNNARVDEYVRIVDRVTESLRNEPYLKGFTFWRKGTGQDGDGYWGEPVAIHIGECIPN